MREPEEVKVVSIKRYNELIEAEDTLRALEDAGVDTWEGYDYAMEMKDDTK